MRAWFCRRFSFRHVVVVRGEEELYEELSEELSSTRRRAHSSFVHRGMAPGVDVAARRNVAVAITDRSTETVQASSQSGQA